MKVLVDMNLAPRWIRHLHAAGFDAIHWSDVGAADAPDSTLMAYAKTHDCVVLTHDLDFSAILAATHGQKPSVVQIRSVNVSPDAIGQQVIDAMNQMSGELSQGALLSVDPFRTRLRLLPLNPP